MSPPDLKDAVTNAMGGNLTASEEGHEVWDLSHHLPDDRIAQGHRLMVHENQGRRSAYLVTPQGEDRVPAGAWSEGEDGKLVSAGDPSPDDKTVGEALKARRTAAEAVKAARWRRAARVIKGLREQLEQKR